MTTTTTRRAVLAGIAATPAASIPAIALPGADLGLLDKLSEWRRLRDRETALFRPYNEAEDRLAAIMDASGLHVIETVRPPMPAEVKRAVRDMTMWAFQSPHLLPAEHPFRIWSEADDEDDRQRKAARAEYRAFSDNAWQDMGGDDLERVWAEAASHAADALNNAIQVPTQTLAGVQAKVRAIVEANFSIDPKEWQQVAADILAVQS